MREVPRDQILARFRRENPWWEEPHEVPAPYADWRPRPYLELFYPLLEQRSVRRALILMGPRRVGKTVMLHHAIGRLIDGGVDPCSIFYVSVDHPLYNGIGLEEYLDLFRRASGVSLGDPCYVFFDEIQYLRSWEVHLKSLVDTFRSVRVVASGSAAAALKLRSDESGAGRFSDFLLPPLTFYEFIALLDKTDLLVRGDGGCAAADIDLLNHEFVRYLNYGGYPEALFSPAVQMDPARYIKSDIVDKVLLRDLPSLYGIQDIQELNSLFTSLAYNTASEVSLHELSQRSGVAKNTIKRYIEYLSAAFLIRTVNRIDRDAKRFKRANFFKVYLTNPSMRAALFSPVGGDDPAMGPLVETAVFSQWFHSTDTELHYARWKGGEVDLVSSDPRGEVFWAVETRWSDAPVKDPAKVRHLVEFHARHAPTFSPGVTTRTRRESVTYRGVHIDFVPASEYCYNVGRNMLEVPHRSDSP